MVGTILVVEDEPTLMEMISRVLGEQGYTVLQAADSADYESEIDGTGPPIDLVLTDVILPSGFGRDVARAVQKRWPRAEVIYMSGYLDLDPEKFPETAGDNFLLKPFSIVSLIQLIKLTMPGR